MMQLINKIHDFFVLKISSVTIKQANMFTTLFIFVFTIIFAYLLIKENYSDYERALNEEQLTKSSIIDVEQQHEVKQKKLKTLLIKNTIAIATLAFILFTIMLGFHKILNMLLQRDMQAFLDFFKESAHNEQVLDPHAIFFKEFKVMVGYANNMVDTISEQKRTLKELNLGLEDKVKKKTAALEITNKNLLKEKQFSEEILKSQKEFLRYTVHETNTPLSVMLTSIELFVMKNGKDRQLSKIEAAAKNIFSIYDDLSYLVKKDQVEYPKIAIDIGAFLNSRLDFFDEVAELSRIRFDYVPHAKNLYVYMNETKLQRVVDNTITNAIKYTLANEMVYVALKQEGTFLDMSVGSKSKVIKDTEKIFDAYYREEESLEGFGIGLRLVRTICDEEGISIQLNSSDEQTTFTYRFKIMGE
ncbi:MAG: HAMP domain-containing sensor histidine kinase [Campylobacterales bacterium]|nr:HAMP domain-containing sensor histidine kinase [Campylobacterales bacterium]